jgi:CRISPR/Cas system-associated exonuclease Cas4 (RecB family)
LRGSGSYLLPLFHAVRKEMNMSVSLVKPRPREETKSSIHFSYSQLGTFLLCPMKYAHHYVWATPWEIKPIALVCGKAIHKAAQVFYTDLKETGDRAPVEKVIGVFELVLEQETSNTEVEFTFKKGETLQSVREQGIELLKLFHAEVKPQKIVAVEFPFSVKVPDIMSGTGNLPVELVGYFDLVESDEQGTYLVVELKTSSQRFSSLKLECDLQATVYSYAMARMKVATSQNSSLVRYDVLLKTKKLAFERYFVTRTQDDYKRLVHLINHVLKAIENRIFYRQTGWQCGDCQFKKACFS